jgi:hypothetical protein
MTAQIGDDLTIDGKPVQLMGCPALPWHHPRLEKLSQKEAIEATENILVFSTACWRQYVASWRLDDGKLYLDKIEGLYRLDGDEPLFADWVTETLRIAVGRRLTYVHMGFGSVYETDRLIKIQMGVVVGSSERDNRGHAHDRARLSWDNLPFADTVTPGLRPVKH